MARLRAMKDKEIHLSAEHPEADPAHIVRGIVRRGLQPVARKEAISLRVDADVLAWFREQGAGWQTRMNMVLKAFKEASAQPPQPRPQSQSPQACQPLTLRSGTRGGGLFPITERFHSDH